MHRLMRSGSGRALLRRGPLFLRMDSAYGTARLDEIAESSEKGSLSVRNGEEGYAKLLANIRRLTVMVLDNLEVGSRDRTLDQGQKRLLSSTGARLLRLWRAVLSKGGTQGAPL